MLPENSAEWKEVEDGKSLDHVVLLVIRKHLPEQPPWKREPEFYSRWVGKVIISVPKWSTLLFPFQVLPRKCFVLKPLSLLFWFLFWLVGWFFFFLLGLLYFWTFAQIHKKSVVSFVMPTVGGWTQTGSVCVNFLMSLAWRRFGWEITPFVKT